MFIQTKKVFFKLVPAKGFKFNLKTCIITKFYNGVWRSWLARLLWEQEAEGSSPFTPTKIFCIAIGQKAFFY